MNEAASTLGRRSAEVHKKRLGKKGMSDAMRDVANKRHGNPTDLTK
jgi:hypothetical protein